MKQSILLLLAIFFLQSSWAQFSNLRIGDIYIFKSRPLIINTSSFGSTGRTLPTVLEDFWTFNDTILYKNQQEIDKLYESGNKDYVILSKEKRTIKRSARQGDFNQSLSKTKVPILAYRKIEDLEERPQYYMYLPKVDVASGNICNIIAVKILHNHLSGMLRSGSTSTLVSFAAKEREKYCKELKSIEILLSEGLVNKKNKKKIESKISYRIKFTGRSDNMLLDNYLDHSEIREAFQRGEDKVIALAITYSYDRISDGFTGRIVPSDFRVLVHARTGRFYAAWGPGVTVTSSNTHRFLKYKELKKTEKKCR
ncbi:MAG: hypothetical protein AAGG68_11950 [Bacteroidota bacterium]